MRKVKILTDFCANLSAELLKCCDAACVRGRKTGFTFKKPVKIRRQL